MHNGEWVAMEYGIAENEEFPPNSPPERDLTPDEALFIVEAWTQMAGEGDFDIETSNSNIDSKVLETLITALILSPITEQVIKDMGKFNNWVLDKINEGWRWGLTTLSKNKTPTKRLGYPHRKFQTHILNMMIQILLNG